MLTSAEFRSLITQGARHIAISANSDYDLVFQPAPSLAIPSVMGATQHFPLDLEYLFPKIDLNIPTRKVKYQEIMFVALKACLRSAVMETSLDSGHLFDAFVNMSETVYVSGLMSSRS